MNGPIRPWAAALAVLALGLALTLLRLGASGLWDPWEPRYAQSAGEMTERGSWAVPHYRGEPRLNRPPLTYWMIAGAQAALGRSEVAARLPSALFGALAPALLTLAFAWRRRVLEGVLAGVALATAPQWILLSRFAMPDVPFATFLTALLALAIAGPRPSSVAWRQAATWGAALLFALASLTDWPRALILPAWGVLAWSGLGGRRPSVIGGLVVAGCYAAGQQFYNVPLQIVSFALAAALALRVLRVEVGLRPRTLLIVAGVSAALVLPWFVIAGQVPGELKVLNYKYALNLGESPGQHQASAWFVLRTVALGALPWIGVAVVGLFRAFGRKRDEQARVLAGAALGGLLFFALSEGKMGHLYGVIQPALAGLAAIGLVHVARRRDWTVALAGAALAPIGWIAWDRPDRVLETATVKRNLFGFELEGPLLACVLLWVVLVSIAVLLRRPRLTLAAALPAVMLAAVLGLWMVPALSPEKSLRDIWSIYQTQRQDGDPIAAFGSTRDSGFYYSNNRIVRLREPHELREFLEGPGSRFVVLTRRDLRKAEAEWAPGRWEVLADGHSSHVLARFEPRSD